MPDATSCAPSIPPSRKARATRFVISSTGLAVPLYTCFMPLTKRPAGIISNAPGIIPCNAAEKRSSALAPAALARSLASPIPAVTASPAPAIGLTSEAPIIPAKEPPASLSLRGTLSPKVDPLLRSGAK